MSEPRVLALVPPGSDACLQWREWWPAKQFNAHGLTYDCLYFNDDFQHKVVPAINSGKYNLVITPRMSCKEKWMVDLFQIMLQRNELQWIYETDDDMFSVEISERYIAFKRTQHKISRIQQDYNEWMAAAEWEAEFLRSERKRILNLVDGSVVTNEPLAAIVRQLTSKPVLIVPNMIDVDWFRKQVRSAKRTVAPLTVGWSGGWRFEQDLEQVAIAWGRIAKRFPDVRFIVHGGWAVPTILTHVPIQQLRLLGWAELDEYPQAMTNIDIMCCSVSTNDWNLRKTPIKWMEASLAGAACVGSHTLYGSAITDNHDGLLATTAEEWEQQIVRLILDENLRKTIHDNAVETITTNHDIAKHWSIWLDAFNVFIPRTLQSV